MTEEATPRIDPELAAQLDDLAAKQKRHEWPDLDHLDPANIQSEDLGFALVGVAKANRRTWWADWPAFHLVTLPGYGVIGYTDEPLGP
ncbi:MAG TPA: hypothetical protein VGF33_07725 [Caulobacteraceae bacterium]